MEGRCLRTTSTALAAFSGIVRARPSIALSSSKMETLLSNLTSTVNWRSLPSAPARVEED